MEMIQEGTRIAQHEAARDLHLVEGDVDGRERKGDGDGERRAARGAPSH